MTKKQFSTPYLNFTISPQVEDSSLHPCYKAEVYRSGELILPGEWMLGTVPDELKERCADSDWAQSALTGEPHQTIFTCSFMAEDGTVCEPESAVISEGIIQDS